MGAAFCSWSGGKDSCLALHRSKGTGLEPVCLLTMMCDDADRSRSHGLKRSVVEAQANAMGIELVTRSVSWDSYEEAFIDALKEIRLKGVDTGIFGDIDLRDHRDWVERVSAEADMSAVLPLWQENRSQMVRECLEAGIDARIVSCRADVMDKSFLGRPLTFELALELESMGIDACGENGEFHTVVVNGPMFRLGLELEQVRVYEHGGHLAMEYMLSSGTSRQ